MKLFFLGSKKNWFSPTLQLYHPETLGYFKILSLQKKLRGLASEGCSNLFSLNSYVFLINILALPRQLLALKM